MAAQTFTASSMRRPRSPPAAPPREARPMRDCGVPVSGAKQPEDICDSRDLNRCLAVTDRGKSAWQKPAVRCNGSALKSVCRDLPARRWLHERGLYIVCGRSLRQAYNFREIRNHSGKNQPGTKNVVEWIPTDEAGALAKAVRTISRAVPCRDRFA